MADRLISALDVAAAPLADADELVVVDKSDVTMAPSGTTKKIPWSSLGLGRAGAGAQIMAGFDTPRQNTLTSPILVLLECGVVSDPGENGHLYFEISLTPTPTWGWKVCYIGNRNRIENLGQTGVGGTIWGIVRPGYWWRYTTYTAAGYVTPQFLTDTGTEFYWQIP